MLVENKLGSKKNVVVQTNFDSIKILGLKKKNGHARQKFGSENFLVCKKTTKISINDTFINTVFILVLAIL